jgi:IclR family acetate operon transcriptional repressor
MRTRAKRASSVGADGPMSVERVVAILELLAQQSEGLTLSEISRAISAPKTSLVGILLALQRLSYVVREDSRYFTGPRAITFALSLIPEADVVQHARPALEQLVRETGETGLVAVLDPTGDKTVYVDKCESTNPIRYTVPVGDRRDLYCSAVGKCFLGFFSDEKVEEYIATRKFEPMTPNTIVTRDRLRAEVRRIRNLGYAETREERVIGVDAIAAPILTAQGRMVAAITIGAPALRLRKNHRACAQAVIRAARQVSNVLGAEGSSSAARRAVVQAI